MQKYEKKPFQEMVIIVLAMLISSLFFPQLKGLFAILPSIYFFVEQRMRKRKQEDAHHFLPLMEGIKQSWVLIVLVGIIFQMLYFFLYKVFFPEMFAQVLDRVSIIDIFAGFDGKLILTLIILAVGEEIVFRGLVQERLQWVIKPFYAMVLTSAVFTFMHLPRGQYNATFLDLISTFLDSMLLGLIYYKTKNIYVAAVAHAMANIVAVYLISGIITL